MTKAIRVQAFGFIVSAVESLGKDDARLAERVREIVKEVREQEANHKALIQIGARTSAEPIPPLAPPVSRK